MNEEIVEIIRSIAKLHLWRDTYPDGPDIVTNNCASVLLEPRHVRAARKYIDEQGRR